MSIQSEINRISSEVTTQTDLLEQIAAELAGKVSGGGSSGPYSAAEIITWTPSEDVQSVELPHSLGVQPDGYHALVRGLQITSGDTPYVVTVDADVNLSESSMAYYTLGTAVNGSNISAVITPAFGFESFATSSKIVLSLGTSQRFQAGKTYEILIYKR